MIQPRPSFRNRPFLRRLIVSFFVLSLIVIVVMGALFSHLSIKSAFRQLGGEYRNNLIKASNGIDMNIEQVSQIYTFMQLNLDVYEYLNQTTADERVKIKAEKQTRMFKQINSYIHSIRLYNGLLDDFISVDSSEFAPNREEEKALIMHTDLRSEPLLSRKLHAGGDAETRVVTLLFRNYDSAGDSVRSAIVINIKESLLRSGFLDNGDNATLILDREGVIVSPTETLALPASASGDAWYQRIIAEPDTDGSFVQKLNGKSYIVTYYKDDNKDWLFVHFQRYGSITGYVYAQTVQIVLIGLLVLLGCCVTALVLSRYLYVPIRNVANFVGEHMPANPADISAKKHEMALFLDAFRNSIQQIRTLEQQSETDSAKLREDYLRRLLKADAPLGDELNGLRETICEETFHCMVVAKLQIDKFDALSETNKIAYQAVLGDLVGNVCRPLGRIETVNLFAGEIAVLIRFAEGNEAEAAAAARKAFAEARDKINETLQLFVTVGIAAPVTDLRHAKAAYDQAHELAKHRFVLGYNRIIDADVLDEWLISSDNYPEEAEERLVGALKQNKRTEFAEHVQDFVALVQHYSYGEARQKYAQLVLACMQASTSVTKSYGRKNEQAFEPLSRLLDVPTLEEAREALIELFDAHQRNVDKLNAMSGEKHVKLCEETMSYVNANYAKHDLGVEALSARVGYTASYFSRIFKEVTGMNVLDYIRQVRINKAKELLKYESYAITDVVEQSGFVNTSHFYAAFKKEVGLTPASYRKLTDQE